MTLIVKMAGQVTLEHFVCVRIISLEGTVKLTCVTSLYVIVWPMGRGYIGTVTSVTVTTDS